MKKALIVYFSTSGNTEKVANSIRQGLEEGGVQVVVKKPHEAGDVDYFDYDLVCIGSPSVEWQPAKPILDFLGKKMMESRKKGRSLLSAPKVPGKHALTFITYSGPHTGLAEAEPAGRCISQFFEHLGFEVFEWYILSEFHLTPAILELDPYLEGVNTRGRMGDIRDKPRAEDLAKIKEDARLLAGKI
jgi:hypothetical protein